MNIKPTIRQATMDDRTQLKVIIGLSFPRFFRYIASNSLNSEGKVLVAVTQGAISGLLNSFNVGLSKYGCVLDCDSPFLCRRGIALSLTNAGTEYLKRD